MKKDNKYNPSFFNELLAIPYGEHKELIEEEVIAIGDSFNGNINDLNKIKIKLKNINTNKITVEKYEHSKISDYIKLWFISKGYVVKPFYNQKKDKTIYAYGEVFKQEDLTKPIFWIDPMNPENTEFEVLNKLGNDLYLKINKKNI